MSTDPISPWGPFCPSAPLLQEAVNHAERISALLDATRPRADDDRGAAWLCGRTDEMRVFVELIVQRWRLGRSDESTAARAISAHLDTIHRGLALHFGKLSLECCCADLFTTSIPASQTTDAPSFEVPRRANEGESTLPDWADLADAASCEPCIDATPTPVLRNRRA